MCYGSLVFTVGTCVTAPLVSLLALVFVFLGIHCGYMCYEFLIFTVGTCVTVPWLSLWAHV